MSRVGTVHARSGIAPLVAMLLMLVFTVGLGFTFGSTLLDSVAGYLEVMEGEIVSASAVHRGETLHLRVDFRHIMGASFDRVALSEFIAGDMRIARGAGDLGTEHVGMAYDYKWGGGSPCTGSKAVAAWPATMPGAPGTACTVNVYQRVNDGNPRPDLLISSGDTVTVEFVIENVPPPPQDNVPGVVLEYGIDRRTTLTRDADVSLYVAP